jgi:DNA-binding ferritin-like protein
MEAKQITLVERLRQELADVRKASLAASNRGDFMKVARLTAMAKDLNQRIWHLENGVTEVKGPYG